MEARPFPVWRSMLYVPVNVDRFLEKAPTSGADAIILDLEDAVTMDEKANARLLVQAAAAQVGRNGSDVLVRINHPWSLAVHDIAACVCPDVDALLLPKVDSPGAVQTIADLCAEQEQAKRMPIGSTRFFVRIESALGFVRLHEIVNAHPRIVAIGLGLGDFSISTGIDAASGGFECPTVQVVIEAKAACVLPIGLTDNLIHYGDIEGFKRTALRSRQLGLLGSPCIHPKQVPVLNEVFRPTDDEVALAQQMMTSYQAAAEKGRGAVGMDGTLVDYANIVGAQIVLDRHQAIQEREQRTRASS